VVDMPLPAAADSGALRVEASMAVLLVVVSMVAAVASTVVAAVGSTVVAAVEDSTAAVAVTGN
jgi:hypothetical protein